MDTLSDVLRAVRHTGATFRTDWLSGLRDPFVGRALAGGANLSRSAFAERFTQFTGSPPMHYLANWRMQLAANQLLSGTDSVAVIANRVGYESEAAFSRAFKKLVGALPSQWRVRRAAQRA